MSERIPVDLVAAAIRGLTKDEADFEITVRPGLTIEGSRGSDPVVKHDGRSYALDDISTELESEILAATKNHRAVIESLRQSKYIDPETNPMIKAGVD